MATPSSPFSFLDGLFDRIGSRLRPPTWAVHEIQQRAVLFLNHVLQQEPEAQQRLTRQQGRVVRFEWRFVTLQLVATPAGLLDLAPEGAVPELTLIVTETSPLRLAGATLRGDKPTVRIVGDVPAHTLGNAARRVAAALRQFVGKAAGGRGRAGTASGSASNE